MYYVRKDVKTGKLNILHESKAFKIALKNKVHNLFLESIQNLDEQELAIFYEDDPFFNKIKSRKKSSHDMVRSYIDFCIYNFLIDCVYNFNEKRKLQQEN